MRIHSLQVTAFGPFAERVDVDLDSLSDAGLFLLTGATGAGKTSVLDAVCFALYGAVPGDRQSAKRLRSDHAAAGTAPEVSMEFTVGGRRFRITRSPAWERPKRRGAGTTVEQPRVLVTERVGSDWHPLASRLDEAGHLVSGLLGMTLTQFCQVQLLPQGRFQAFLRADSRERHSLLQQLFRTSRFEAVEGWLRDRRRLLRRESGRQQDRVADLLSRISETADVPIPERWDLGDLPSVLEEVGPWAGDIVERATGWLHDAQVRASHADACEQSAREDDEAGRRLHDQQQRLRQAHEDRSSLSADQEAHHQRVECLDRARDAGSVLPLREVAQRAAVDLDSATAEADAALAEAGGLLGAAAPTATDLRAAHHDATERTASVRARLPLVEERSRLAERLEESGAELRLAVAELAELDARLETLPAEVAALRSTEAELKRSADRLPAAREQAAAAASRLSAGRLVAELVAERTRAEARHRESVELALHLKEQWLALQERRLAGMAAEIAGGLAVGACCPVCGSEEHPHPASPAPDAPDLAAERAARRDVDDAEAARHARDQAVRDLDTRILHAREQAAHRTVPVLEREAEEAAAVVARLESRVAELDEATAARTAAEASLDEAGSARTDLIARRTALATELEQRHERVAAIDAELGGLLADTPHASLAELLDHLAAVEAATGRALQALEASSRATTVAHEARDRAESAAVGRGFGSLADAVAASLPADEVAELERRVRLFEQRTAALGAVLDDPDLRGVDALPTPDLAALRAARAGAEAELTEARATESVAGGRLRRLSRLRDELTTALADWQPLLARLELADRLASLAEGSSPDNRLRMRLSGFVLGFRLRQVVAAANDRLVGMTDGRYRLEHTTDRGAGENRGGLSLRVRDDWTGEARDPVTLSGGETFVVSLALALGLADVITFEAGGAELDTLFVDEGFGTLDAETLDDVMDTLDALRDGGRVVGVVSHVAEMRDRIPAQLHVRKHRAGSTVHQGAVG